MNVRWIGPAIAALALWPAAASACAQEQAAGARSRALGGAGTAFEDDPHSIWLNPAGTATQPGGLALSFETYLFYEEFGDPPDETHGRANFNDPIFIPSFLGVVLQVGSPELPQAVGLCLATPYHLFLPFSGPNPTTLPPSEVVVSDQTFHRLRLSYAVDVALRPARGDGFLNHVALGLGLDLAMTRFECTRFPGDVNSRDHDFAFSGGAGVLLGLLDNGEDLRLTLGVAYQGRAAFGLGGHLDAPSGIAPFFDWPQQLQAGLAIYLLERLPLKVYLEAKWTDWKAASEKSSLAGIDSFESTLDVSAGVEYRIGVDPNAALLPRAGLRYEDAPWKRSDLSRLPAWADRQLFIDTQGGKFVVFSFGLGLAWGYKEGTQDSLDIAFEFGGDAPGFALSYTFQF